MYVCKSMFIDIHELEVSPDILCLNVNLHFPQKPKKKKKLKS